MPTPSPSATPLPVTAAHAVPTLRVATTATPVGELRVVVSDRGVRAILWETDGDRVSNADGMPIEATDDPITARAVEQLHEYFAGERATFDLPLDVVGTEFQVLAWQALGRIPFGHTRTYAEQAADIGRPSAVRAVGAANGRNPVSIVVPCHRVVGADGGLTGFAGGIDAKRFLLDHERSISGRGPATLFDR